MVITTGIILCYCNACGFVDLRPIGVTIIPDKTGAVLAGEYSPVVVGFDTEMNTNDAEGILQISSDAGILAGDVSWKGNDLYFVPAPGWTAGVRYTLSLSGTVKSADGRELRLDRHIFFYAINASAAPLLERFSPADGESVGADGLIMELCFSRPMDRLSVETALTIDSIGEKQFDWSDDNRTLSVIPAKAPTVWTVYRWTLKADAKSSDGVPLARAVSARFYTDLDRYMPRVTGVFPVIHSGGRWLPAGTGIAQGPGPGQGIAVEFNKAMGDSTLRSIHFEPPLTGRTEQLSEKLFVFIPAHNPEPETVYTLIVSADAKDTGGLKLGEDYRVCFSADIPFLRIHSFAADGVPPLEPAAGGDLGGGAAFVVPVDIASGNVLCFTIHFSLPFTTGAQHDTALAISLSPFFPGTLYPIALRSVEWLSDDRLRMKWEGLYPGTDGEAHYYRLHIPGGTGGVNNGDGMYLKEDQNLYLEAKN
jgi:hypothetical protein